LQTTIRNTLEVLIQIKGADDATGAVLNCPAVMSLLVTVAISMNSSWDNRPLLALFSAGEPKEHQVTILRAHEAAEFIHGAFSRTSRTLLKNVYCVTFIWRVLRRASWPTSREIVVV
jgi:hypothetical protein